MNVGLTYNLEIITFFLNLTGSKIGFSHTVLESSMPPLSGERDLLNGNSHYPKLKKAQGLFIGLYFKGYTLLDEFASIIY